MKKHSSIISAAILLTLCLLLSVSLFTTPSFASDSTEVPTDNEQPGGFTALEKDETVYVSEQAQDELFSLLCDPSCDMYPYFKNHGLTPVKESISKWYRIDIMDYYQTGILDVVPIDVLGHDVYSVKMITEDGEYAGNFPFYIADGTAMSLGFCASFTVPDSNNTHCPASCSYADHAERIKHLLGRSDYVPVENIRYVSMGEVGMKAFYIQDEDTFYIIPLGEIWKDEVPSMQDTVITPDGLKEIASDYMDFLDEMEAAYQQYQKDFPDADPRSFLGAEYSSPVSGGSVTVNNINNIKEYLAEIYGNHALGESTTIEGEATDTAPAADVDAASCRSALAWPVGAAAGAAALLLRKRQYRIDCIR